MARLSSPMLGALGPLCAALFLLLLSLSTTAAASSGFVRVKNTHFELDGKDFVFAGFNMWQMIEAAANVPVNVGRVYIPPGKTGQQTIVDTMNIARANGLTVMRAWAHAVLPEYATQTAPGVYNEHMLRGLDFAIVQASKHGLKVALSLVDNWQATGGVSEFVSWCSPGGAHVDFYTHEWCRSMYRSYASFLTTRVNTLTGVAYKDDPTIMAWSLINEPRCLGDERKPSEAGGSCQEQMQSWLETMAPFVKKLAPKQLVTLSSEGFYGPASSKTWANPGPWAAQEGQDFLRNAQTPGIDYVSIHLWVDNWQRANVSFQSTWIEEHIKDATQAGKPLVLEEFGKLKDGGQRDQFYRHAYNQVEAGARAGRPLRGSAFWLWLDDGMVVSTVKGEHVKTGGDYGVFRVDSTFQIIKKHASDMNALCRSYASRGGRRLMGSTAAGAAADSLGALWARMTGRGAPAADSEAAAVIEPVPLPAAADSASAAGGADMDGDAAAAAAESDADAAVSLHPRGGGSFAIGAPGGTPGEPAPFIKLVDMVMHAAIVERQRRKL